MAPPRAVRGERLTSGPSPSGAGQCTPRRQNRSAGASSPRARAWLDGARRPFRAEPFAGQRFARSRALARSRSAPADPWPGQAPAALRRGRVWHLGFAASRWSQPAPRDPRTSRTRQSRQGRAQCRALMAAKQASPRPVATQRMPTLVRSARPTRPMAAVFSVTSYRFCLWLPSFSRRCASIKMPACLRRSRC